MDENPYWTLLQAKKQRVQKLLTEDFAATYVLLAITILWMAAMTGPILALVIDSWYSHVINVPLVVFACLSLVLGAVLSGVLEKIGKYLGTWKRPTLFSDDETRLKSSGLWFYPPSACRMPSKAALNSSALQ